jgi:hypothetical protein
MRKKLIAVVGAALLLTGCSAASNADTVRDICVTAAEEEVGASIDATEILASSLDDAMFESGVVDDRKTDNGNGLFTAAGQFTYEVDGTQSRRGMLCLVTFEDGKPGAPDLTITGG